MTPYLSHPFVLIPLAALLGGVIGWFLRRIRALREAHRASLSLNKKLQGRDRYIAQLKTELAEAEDSVETSLELGFADLPAGRFGLARRFRDDVRARSGLG